MAFKRRKSDVNSVNQKNAEVNIVYVEKNHRYCRLAVEIAR